MLNQSSPGANHSNHGALPEQPWCPTTTTMMPYQNSPGALPQHPCQNSLGARPLELRCSTRTALVPNHNSPATLPQQQSAGAVKAVIQATSVNTFCGRCCIAADHVRSALPYGTFYLCTQDVHAIQHVRQNVFTLVAWTHGMIRSMPLHSATV